MNSKTHKCATIGCNKQVKTDLLMCRAHWALLPRPLQMSISIFYRKVKRGEDGALETYRSHVRSAMQYLRN